MDVGGDLTPPEIAPRMVITAPGSKRSKISSVQPALKDGLCVVFVETKRGADSLEIELHKAGSTPGCCC